MDDCQYCGGLGQAPYGPALDLEPCAVCSHEDIQKVWVSDREYYIECVYCGDLP